MMGFSKLFRQFLMCLVYYENDYRFLAIRASLCTSTKLPKPKMGYSCDTKALAQKKICGKPRLPNQQ